MSARFYDLSGLFFLTFGDEGELQFQGQIVERLQPGYFLCQLYGAFFGEPTNCIIRAVCHMTDWKFFDDAEQWNRAYRNASPKDRR